MKRTEFESLLKDNGFWFLRDSKHCIWTNGTINVAVPHHKELNKFLVKKIMRTIEQSRLGVNYQERLAA
jgi:predicted RNA binding protein YcfA (HicA-like mRNA interferase family)